MIRELAHSIFALVILTCIIIGAAFLTGCATEKAVFDCATHSQDCN
jgi:hypothetical protein